MSYTHITIDERACIKKFTSEGVSTRKIVQYLGRSPSSILRKLRRNKGHDGVYHPVTANKLYLERIFICGRPIKLYYESLRYVNLKIGEN